MDQMNHADDAVGEEQYHVSRAGYVEPAGGMPSPHEFNEICWAAVYEYLQTYEHVRTPDPRRISGRLMLDRGRESALFDWIEQLSFHADVLWRAVLYTQVERAEGSMLPELTVERLDEAGLFDKLSEYDPETRRWRGGGA